VGSKAVYLALAVLRDGTREILGIWIEQTEGAKFWLKVFADLKSRGCQDILIAVTDGLKGMAEALNAAYPATTLQTCIVHLLRHSMEFANWKQRKPLATALRPIYTAPTAEAALAALDTFERGPWGVKFPMIVASWRRAWMHVIPFFAFPPEIRHVIYTTNTLESPNARVRKIIKTRGHFPTDEAATKLIWLALRNITAAWSRTPPAWRPAMNQFAILYADRFLTRSRSMLGAIQGMDAAVLWTHRTRPQGLGKPLRTRFPTAPTPIIGFRNGRRRTNGWNREARHQSRPTHKNPDTPHERTAHELANLRTHEPTNQRTDEPPN
jgi:Transposase, Mutator family